MASYRFLTTWILDAPLERVWDAIYAIERWPELVARRQAASSKLEHGDGDGDRLALPARVAQRRSRTPSASTTRITEVERPHLIEASADGRARRDRAAGGFFDGARDGGHVRVERAHDAGRG